MYTVLGECTHAAVMMKLLGWDDAPASTMSPTTAPGTFTTPVAYPPLGTGPKSIDLNHLITLVIRAWLANSRPPVARTAPFTSSDVCGLLVPTPTLPPLGLSTRCPHSEPDAFTA